MGFPGGGWTGAGDTFGLGGDTFGLGGEENKKIGVGPEAFPWKYQFRGNRQDSLAKNRRVRA